MTSLGGFAQAQARRFGNKPLFLCGEEVVTYRGYDERTDWLAGGLARLGLGRGDRMAVLLPNGLPIVEAYMGAAKLGAVSVPLNPMFTPRKITYPKEIENVLHGHPAVLECAVVAPTGRDRTYRIQMRDFIAR